MRVSQLLRGVESSYTGPDISVTGLAYDSRQVLPGNLFFAVSGLQIDGHQFVEQAVCNGATIVVVERLVDKKTVPQILVKDTRRIMGLMAANFYKTPSHWMRVIGVTGTNGKTTTTHCIKAILEEAGFSVGLVGTIANQIGEQVLPTTRTTPESVDLQRLLRTMLDQGVEYVVMEVSSHALSLHRTVGLEFDVAVFTNLSQDHLDFHPSFSEYLAAKALLFSGLKVKGLKGSNVAIVNYDDEHGLTIASKSGAPVFGYGMETPAQFSAHSVQMQTHGVTFRLQTPIGHRDISTSLAGRFNVYNCLAAAAACQYEGVALSVIQEGLANISGVPGRFQPVDMGQPYSVIIDYAHTPDGLANILQTARTMTKRRLITVFGAGGDRDRTKRPVMGKVAARYSHYSIVTSDNPRSEQPAAICADIAAGMPADADFTVIIDRRQAIVSAITMATAGDVVVIAGKGHETYQEFADGTIHFDDFEEARNALKEQQKQ